MATGRHKLQVDLSSIVAAPFLVSPFWVGFAVGTEHAIGALIAGNIWWYLPAVVFFYVTAFCWLATRHFDRRSDFRKFPFRGSMLLGAIAGPCFTIQFASAAYAAYVAQNPLVLLGTENVLRLVANLCVLMTQSTLAGVFFGAWLGLLSGSVYCAARRVKEQLTGRSTIRPGQTKRRFGIE